MRYRFYSFVFVFIFGLGCASLCSAQEILRVSESGIRIHFQSETTTADLPLRNISREKVSASIALQLIDPHGTILAQDDRTFVLSPGVTSARVVLPAISAAEKDLDKGHLFLYRLRYTVIPDYSSRSAFLPFQGIVSISEVAPQLFELHAAAPEFVEKGNHYVMHVRAIHPVTSAPAPGVLVQGSIDSDNPKPVLTTKAVTDSRGYASLEYSVPADLDADPGRNKTIVTGSREGFIATATAELLTPGWTFKTISTDKALYQPGQTLHMRLLAFGTDKKALEGQAITFEISDPEDTVVYRVPEKTSRYGIASADWQIPDNLRLGTYEITANFTGGRYEDGQPRTTVKISRYDLPTFAVAVKPDHAYYLAGQNANVEIRANYVYGEPVRRGHVRVVHETERQWDFREQKWKVTEEEAYEGETDSQGKFVAAVDLTQEHESIADDTWKQFENSTYSAYFTDAVTGRTENRRFDLRVTRDPIHIYLIRNGPMDYPHEFYLSTDYADGTPAQCEIEIKWARVESSKNGNVPQAADEKLLRRIRTNRYGVAKITGLITPNVEKSDEFVFILDANDGKGAVGHETETVRSFDVRDYTIRVATDKILYQQGDPIEVELKSTAPDTAVTVDALHGGKVVATQMIRLNHGRASLTFPPNEEFQNQVTIVAYAFGAKGEADSGESHFSSYRDVLFPENHEISLDVKLAKTTYLPGGNVPADLRVSGPDGQQIRGAVGLVVVDRAVDELQKADRDLRRNSGFYGFRRMIDDDEFKGVHYSDLNKVDLSKPLPEGFELVAEMLVQEGSSHAPTFFDVSSENRRASEFFADEIGPQLKSVRMALDSRYESKAEYPKTAAAVKYFLSAEGIDITALRDPWGMSYYMKFSVERNMDVVEIWTSGPDKRRDTSDDYRVLTQNWPYFKEYERAIDRVVKEFHTRTGGFIRDTATLTAELSMHGIQFDTLRDPWGHAYKLSFGTEGKYLRVTVTSAGPSGVFTKDAEYSYDNFTVGIVDMDYFQDTRVTIDHALSDNFNKTLEYPENMDQFRNVLQKYGINWDELKDPWGHEYIVLFSRSSMYKDDVTVKNAQDNLGDNLHRTTVVPVTLFVEWIHILSPGSGAKDRYTRDFEAASFSHTLVKQSSADNPPVSLLDQPVLTAGMGAITGIVSDADRKAIIGAQVTAQNSVTKEAFMAITGDTGVYVLRNLPPGRYLLGFSFPNFKSLVIANVSVFSGTNTSADATLQVGETSVTVEVAAGQVLMETVNTSTQATIDKTAPRTPKSAQAPPLISTPRLRQYFPETLFWQPELITDSAGRAHLNIPLADNITTWKLSAVASTEKGEIASAEKDIRAFQPFFVEHDPPKFLTDGDEIDLPVFLRNYTNHLLRMNVAMKPENWFAPLGPASVKTDVPAGEAVTDVFKFRAAAPIKNGKQRITATGAGAAPGDAIERTITVRPNGEERTETRSQVFDDTASLDLQIPASALPGSIEGELKIYPNLNAHILESIEAILERPYGCAEQTISSAYPSILLLKYLKTSGIQSSPLAPKAHRYVQQGYDRLLSYRAEHGGFSYWGKGDPDLALTAYAIRFLQDASEFIEIDDSIVDEQLKWVLRKAESDGRWSVHDWNHKENLRQTLVLTAYIARTIADLDFRDSLSTSDKQPEKTTSQALKLSLDYLAPKVAEMDEPYLIATYALALPSDKAETQFAASLERLRKLERREADGSYWMLETNTPFYGWGLAGRIETTAIVLQALKKGSVNGTSDADRELLSRGLLFLLKNQDRFGIWYSSQATINVLEALRILTLRNQNNGAASAAQSSKAGILVDGHAIQTVDLPPSNELISPITVDIARFLSPGNHHVEIHRAAGATPTSLQAVTVYYVPWAGKNSGAAFEHQGKVSDALSFGVHFDNLNPKTGEIIHCAVNAERIGFRGYGMMLAEIGLPPGAEVDRESLDHAVEDTNGDINQYEILPDRIILYLWPRAGGTKFTFALKVRYGITAFTPPSILYDYYNPEARATVLPAFFSVHQ